MEELILAAVIASFGLIGAVLRFSPFITTTPTKKRRAVWLWYGALTALYTGILAVTLHFVGLEKAADCLQIGGNIFAFAVSVPLLLVLRENYRVHIFLLGVVASCQYLLLSIPAFVVSFDWGLTPGGDLLLLFGVYGLILLATYYPMRRLMIYTVEPFLHMQEHGYWDTVCFVPLAFFFAIIFIVWAMKDVDSLHQLISSQFSCSMLLFMCVSVAADQKRIQERKRMEQQLSTQKNHYAELKVRIEDARKTRHDLKHLIAVIRHYMDTDDKSGLQQYCDDLQGTMEKGSIPYTGNAAADGVVYQCMLSCKKEGIDFSYSGTIRSTGISDMDLCVLLGNALENALAGCRTVSQNRRIQLVCQTEQQVLSVLVSNTFDGVIRQEHGELVSRKREGRIGVGMRSMKEVVARCGGTMDTDWDESNFRIVFILPIKEE